MSRCFPFPPPGFELKARSDDVNLIIKEKKEKKKKHKDKKERSKRKENEFEGDHRESKKRKRKDKDKDRKKKDKQNSSGKSFVENPNGEELDTDRHIKGQRNFPESPVNQMVHRTTFVVEKTKVDLNKTDHIKMTNEQSVDVGIRQMGNSFSGDCNQVIQKTALLVEKTKVNLEKTDHNKMANEQKRLGNGYSGNSNQIVPKTTVDVRRMGNNYFGNFNQMVQKTALAVEKTKVNLDKTDHNMMTNGQKQLGNGYFGNCNQMVQKNTLVVEKTKVELDKTNKMTNGQKQLGNGYLGNCNQMVQKNTLVVEKTMFDLDKTDHNKMANDQKLLRNGNLGNCNQMVQKNTLVEKTKVNFDNTDLSKMANERFNVDALRMRNSYFSVGEDQIGSCQLNNEVEKRKDVNGMNGYGTGFDQNKNTKAKPLNGFRNGCINGDQKMRASDEGDKEKEKMTLDGQRNPTKHKELKGFLNGVRPNTSRCVLSPPVDKEAVRITGNENHKISNVLKPEPCPPPANKITNKTPLNHSLLTNGLTIVKTDTKELKMNGSVEDGKHTNSSKPLKSKKPKPPPPPPHPDLKYLNEVLSVPRNVELPQGNEEWLFGCKGTRPKLPPSPNPCTKPIWAEAMQLESIDIIALPYVFPH